MFIRTQLPPSATLPQRLFYPLIRNGLYFFLSYLPYAPVKRFRKVRLDDGPYLWASSHSNYLCDCLPAGTEGPAPTRFLAKSTLFRFPIKGIIEFCGALPVTRPEDVRAEAKLGENRSAQNRSTFKVAINAMEKGWPVAIFPEGTSIVSPGLVLPLKPGIGKMAFAAEEANDFRLGLKIVPVGLEYVGRVRVGSGLNIRYGKPLALADYRSLHGENKEEALRRLMADLTREMVSVYPHFQDETKFALGRKLVTIGIARYRYDVAQLFLAKEGDGAFWAGLNQRMKAFEEANKEHRIPLPAWGHRRVWKEMGPSLRRRRAFFLVAWAPFALLDVLSNSLPEFALSSVVEQVAVDETEKMTLRFLLAPIVVTAVLGAQFWFVKRFVLEEAWEGAGSGAFLLYLLASFLLWHVTVHWKKQFKRVASLVFFRRAGVNRHSAVVAHHRALRQYLGELQDHGREGGQGGESYV
jgi:1-acyl-sn-glycerol-3-phosphate acyltransferase